MSRGFLTNSRYSPGNMDVDSLEALFVGRERMLRGILKKLAASATVREKHFVLLIGPRGSGKTHFVALAWKRLKFDPKYQDARRKLKIAYLNEEEWGVASYLDFLVRILQSLDSDESIPIDELFAEYERDPDAARDRAEQLLQAAIRNKTLLLICENLNDLFDGIGEEGQRRWRALIQEHPFWSILATAPALFSDIQLQQSPFHGFFTIRSLKPLDFDQALELLRKKARHDRRDDLAAELGTPVGRARVRAIHHLAGGNHRVYVVLYDFLDKESLDDFATPFMRMVDDLTPYYQDRMRQLAPRQRKLVEFLSRRMVPVAVKDIARRCMMSQQTAAKQLGELLRLGVLRKSARGRESLYEVAEPLMRICFEVKDNQTDYLELFVEFLRNWFSGRELAVRAGDGLPHGRDPSALDRVHVSAAIQAQAEDHREPFLESLDHEARKCWDKGDYDGVIAAMKQLIEDRHEREDYRLCVLALHELRRYEESVEWAHAMLDHYPDAPEAFVSLAQSHLAMSRIEQALDDIDRAMELGKDQSRYRCLRGAILLAAEDYERVIENENAALSINPEHLHSFLNRGRAFLRLKDFTAAERDAREVLEREPESVDGLTLLARALEAQDRHRDVVEVGRRLLRIMPGNNNCRSNIAQALIELDEFEEALAILDEMIAREPDSVSAHCRRGTCLLQLGRLEDAVASCDKLLDLDPDHAHAYLDKAVCLDRLERADDAIESLQLLAKKPSANASELAYGAGLARRLRAYGVASELCALAVQEDDQDETAWVIKACIELDANQLDDSSESLRRAAGLGADEVVCRLLDAELTTARSGFDDGLALVKGLSDDQIRDHRDEVVSAAAKMLALDIQRVGLGSVQENVASLRTALAGHMQSRILGAIVTNFIVTELEMLDRPLDEWTSAITRLRSSIGGLSQCRIPLNMLDVASRFLFGEDESALLDLPLEQRDLIRDLGIRTSRAPKDVPGARADRIAL